MKPGSPAIRDVPLKIVGSTKFGRFPKMSTEETFNMIIADDWLVPFAGYKRVVSLNEKGEGRGIYASDKLKKMFAVINDRVYIFDANLSPSILGLMDTFTGDVFIAENNNGQVVFSDNKNLYVYTSLTSEFVQLTAAQFSGSPGYITYQDTRIISPNLNSSFWQISDVGDAKKWPGGGDYLGSISTKPTNCVACVRFPGMGNLLLVFGTNVTEFFTDVGSQLFPYQRSQSHSIDYGCINPASIAANENMVCWVGINEQSGPAIMYTAGAEVKKISTDGIDYRLSELVEPANCYGFMVRLSGHVFYVVTWAGEKDQVTYAYDFNTQAFFTLCDENMNAFIVKRVAFFNEQYFFVSLIDGNLYELSASFDTYDYGDSKIEEIPFIRIPPNLQMPDQSRFVAPYSGFTIQQGSFDYTNPATNRIPRIDLCVSKDGGVNFGSNIQKIMQPKGNRANRLMWRSLGAANDLTQQFRFHGFSRFICTDGITGVRQ